MAIDNRTTNRNYPLPHPSNLLAQDVLRLGEALNAIDADVANRPEVAAVTAQINQAIDALIGGAPGALDTLNELAAALGDDANFATTVTNQLAELANFTQAGAGAVQRTVEAKLRDVVSVKDFGVVGDGVTNNTAAYAALVAATPEGSIIYWPPGTYVGQFYSTKAFTLVGGPNVILKHAGGFAIYFLGSIASPQALSVAPAFGSSSLSGTTGLVAGDIVELYSGNTRPGDGLPINYELVRMLDGSGNIEGQVLSAQTGGSPTYAKITPLRNIRVQDFTIDDSGINGGGILVRYAENFTAENIHMLGGSSSTIQAREVYGAVCRNISRSSPTLTGSGQGYNMQFFIAKTVLADTIRGVKCRHTFDADSTYYLTAKNILSQDGASSDVVMTHNGYGGAHTYENIQVVNPSTYAMHTSSQGIADADRVNQTFRDVKIENLTVRCTTAVGASAQLYFQYQVADLDIKNVFIECNETHHLVNSIAIRFVGTILGRSSIRNVTINRFKWAFYLGMEGGSWSTDARHDDTLLIENLSCFAVQVGVYDNYPATDWLWLYVDDVRFFDSSFNALDAFVRVSNVHNGIVQLRLTRRYNSDATSSNRILDHPDGMATQFINNVRHDLSSSLAASHLTQTHALGMGDPGGRIMATQTVSTMDRPIGVGQTINVFANGTVTFDDPNIIGGPHTATAGQVVKLIAINGYQWRFVTAGTWQ